MRHKFNWGVRFKSKHNEIEFWSLYQHNIVQLLSHKIHLKSCLLLLFPFLIVLCPTSKWHQLAGFHLHVVRDLTEKTKTLPPPIPASESIINVTETPKTNGSVSTTSLAVSKPVDPIPSSGSIQRFLNKAADEGLVIIQSPKVRIWNLWFTSLT